MSFNKLYGHETIKKSLISAVMHDRVSNAYVFEGIEGVGKKLCAKIFAQALVCKKEDAPCGRCQMCIQAKARTLPDIIYVVKDSDKTQIGVDNVREQVIAEAYLKPRFAKRKIFVIEQGDILSDEAQNALLKVLEEPPSYVTFIICVTKKEKLLQTVLSRSQTISFFPLPCDVIENYLLEFTEIKEDEASILAKLSQGSIGTAVALANDEDKKARIEKALTALMNLKKGAQYICEMVDFLTQEKENTTEIIDYLMTFLRDCVMVKTDLSEKVVFSNKLSDMMVFTQDLTKKKLISAFDKLSGLKVSLKQNLKYSATVSETVMRIWEDFHD